MASSRSSKINENEIILTDLDQSNASECHEMINSAFESDHGYSGNVDFAKYERYTKEEFEKARANGTFRVAQLKATNQMVGAFYVSAYEEKIDDVMRKIIFLEAVSVGVKFQKRGVSKLLLYEAEKVAREMAAYAIEGNVMDFADWEIPKLVTEASATILEKLKITRVDFPDPESLSTPIYKTRLRKVIEY